MTTASLILAAMAKARSGVGRLFAVGVFVAGLAGGVWAGQPYPLSPPAARTAPDAQVSSDTPYQAAPQPAPIGRPHPLFSAIFGRSSSSAPAADPDANAPAPAAAQAAAPAPQPQSNPVASALKRLNPLATRANAKMPAAEPPPPAAAPPPASAQAPPGRLHPLLAMFARSAAPTPNAEPAPEAAPVLRGAVAVSGEGGEQGNSQTSGQVNGQNSGRPNPLFSALSQFNPFTPRQATPADAAMNAQAAMPDAAPPPRAAPQAVPDDTAIEIPPVPDVDRNEVSPRVATASKSLAATASLALRPRIDKPDVAPDARQDHTGALPDARARRGGVFPLSLKEAVGAAVMSHPLMGAQAARVGGSLADVRGAEGAMRPQLQVFAGSGGSYLGSYSNSPHQFGAVDIPGSSRSDAGFTLRQLVYDFGAAKADVARTKSLVNAERLRLADQAEDIALRTVNAYLNLLEQAELIALIDRVVADDNNFANVVKLNEKQGNGTLADVNRIKSKVIEVEAVRTDIVTAHKTAQDEFYRLTKLDPSQIRKATPSHPPIPPSFDAALSIAKQCNPSLLALSANGVSLDYQLKSQKAQRLPRIDLQGDGLMKHYVGATSAASQGIVDTRLMLMLSYKLMDGGVLAAQTDRIREDKTANDFKTLDEKESIELNLKRFYQALSSNRVKENAALQGTATAQKASTLYLEQFKSGKRTVFEVLDSRMVVFTMQKNAVNAKYEQLRSGFGILRNMGQLVETAARP